MLNSCCLAILLGSVLGLNIGVPTVPSYLSSSTSSSPPSISFFRQVSSLNASIPAGFSTSSISPVAQSAAVGTPPLQVITVYQTVELTVTKLVDYCACPSIAPLPSGQLNGASQTGIPTAQATIAQGNNNQASEGSEVSIQHEGNGVSDAAAGANMSGPLVNTASTYTVTSTVSKTLPASTFTTTFTNSAGSVFVQTLTTRSTTTELQTTVVTQAAAIATSMTASQSDTAPSSTIQPVYQNTSMSGNAALGSPTLVQPSVSVVTLTTSRAASSGSGGAAVDGQGFGEPTSTSLFSIIAFSSTSIDPSEMSSAVSGTVYPASVTTDSSTESSSTQEATTTSESSTYNLSATAPSTERESTSTEASPEPSSTIFSVLSTFSFSTAWSAFNTPLTSSVESESSSTLYTSTVASAGSSQTFIDTTATSTSTTSVDMTSTTYSPITIISSSSSTAATSLISPVTTTTATSSNAASVTTSAVLTTLASSVEYESSSTSDVPTFASSIDSSLSLIDIGTLSTSTTSMEMTSMTDSSIFLTLSPSSAAATDLTSSTSESTITTSMTSSDAALATPSVPIVIDLVQNGGFEDEDASGGYTAPWSFTTTKGTVRSSTNVDFHSNSGTHYAILTGYLSQSVALQQTLTSLLPGTEYVLQYFYKQFVILGASHCTFAVLLDTVVIDTVPSENTQQAIYTSKSVSVRATAASQVLQFVLTCPNTGGGTRDYLLDDISFTTTV